MIAFYDVGSLLSLLLATAFFLVWFNDRSNLASMAWGIAHSALSLAALLGYRYQLNHDPLLGLLATILTAIFLSSMSAANLYLLRRRLRVSTIFLSVVCLTALIGFIGFGFDQFAGRLSVLILLASLYFWSGWIFASILRVRYIAIVFFIKALSVLINATAGQSVHTIDVTPLFYVQNWLSNILLILTLLTFAFNYSRNRLEHVIEHLTDAVCAIQSGNSLLFANSQFAKLAGEDGTDPRPNKTIEWLLISNPAIAQIVRDIHLKKRRSKDNIAPVRLEETFHPRTGQGFDAEIGISTYSVFATDLIIIQIRDISDRKHAEAERLRLVTTDGLTGLYNRKNFDERLSYLLWEAERSKAHCAVAVLDIRNFKRINDIADTALGDKILIQVAQIIRQHSKPNDLFARLGNDEFAVARCGTDNAIATFREQFTSHINALLSAIDLTVKVEQLSLPISANAGIAFDDGEESSATTLTQGAQLALTEAKAAGVNEAIVYDSELDSRLSRHVRIEAALRRAIDNNELHLVFQPITNLQNGKMEKVEALIRWTNEHLGFVSPGEFIPIAEQTGQIANIGAWVIKTAFAQAKAWWQNLTNAPVIGINLSVQQLSQSNFAQNIQQLASEYGVDPRWIDLEITETLFAGNVEKIDIMLERLHRAGFTISLDDFGTGYSSLSYLSHFQINTVKIDRSFVDGMDKDAKRRSIVRAIISMGHSLSLNVVAEGVETVEERNCLLEFGCDYFQGYLFSPPVSPEKIVEFCQQN